MSNSIKFIIALLLIFTLSACATIGQSVAVLSWQLVFENDEQGNRISGSKDVLIEAVRSGKPVRVYFAGRTIEHAVEANFLSIFEGEVFAQLIEIQSQRPGRAPVRIEFRTAGEKRRAIIGTNGFVTAYIDGNEPNNRAGGSRWYVQN